MPRPSAATVSLPHAAERAMGLERRGEAVDEPGLRQRIEAVLPPQAEDPERARLALDPRLDPADEPIAEEDRQDVVAPATLRGRDVDLPDVVEVEQACAAGRGPRRTDRAAPGRRPRRRRRRARARPRPRPRPRRPASAAPSASTKRSPRTPSTATGTSVPSSTSSASSTRRPALGGSPPRRRRATARCRSRARRCPVARAGRARDSATAACGGAARGSGSPLARGARPGRAARRGRRRGGCPSRRARPRMPGLGRVPRGWPGPGSSAASTSRSPPAARNRWSDSGPLVADPGQRAPRPAAACSSNAPPLVASPGPVPGEPVPRQLGRSARSRGPCCRSRTGARASYRSASVQVAAVAGDPRQRGRGRGCARRRRAGRTGASRAGRTTARTPSAPGGSERGGARK